jgi:murein DD-endopeptidase MepM/ murein hydrolase activator NlpD
VPVVVRRLLPLGLVLAVLGSQSAARAGDGSWVWPVPEHGGTAVLEGFDAPDTPYAAGHRGIDLATVAGAPVRSVAAGVVTFAGRVGGVGVVTVDHGSERSTYQPVIADVEVGQHVAASAVVGHVAVGPFHCAMPCLHLGRIARAGERYLDPLDRLASRTHIRLVDPDGPPPVPPIGAAGSGVLRRPVAGPVTSGFGWRKHPITGKRSHHDGVDFGAACGSAVHAAAEGTVVAVEHSGAYGLHIAIRHGADLETSYGHLAAAAVAVGDAVTTSVVVGRVGSSGLSTGCHLHFGVRRSGRAVDPVTLL